MSEKMRGNVSQQTYDQAVKEMGREPINPIGSCFDSAAAMLAQEDEPPPNFKLCHGIGIASMPGQVGRKMKHAWLEFDDPERGRGRGAIDPIWGVAQRAELYRKNLKIKYCVEYTKAQMFNLWLKHDYPGPWDRKIKKMKGIYD